MAAPAAGGTGSSSSGEETPISDPTANKALVAEFIDALFTRGELEAVDRYLAPGFVNHDPFPGFAPDREGDAPDRAGLPAGLPRLAGRADLPRPGRHGGGALGPHRRPGPPAAARDRASNVDVTSGHCASAPRAHHQGHEASEVQEREQDRDPLLDVVNGQYSFGSFPSPNASHSARQYGDAGKRSSRAPITLYLAVFTRRYERTR